MKKIEKFSFEWWILFIKVLPFILYASMVLVIKNIYLDLILILKRIWKILDL